VTQYAIKISDPGFRRCDPQAAADTGEEFLTGLAVIFSAQGIRDGLEQGTAVKENVRPVQTHIKQSAKPPNGPAGITGHIRQHLGAESVMSICRGHTSPSFAMMVIFYST
jgi:hypothetical protein